MDEEDMHPIFRAVSGGDVEEVARLLDAEPHLMEARNPVSSHQTSLMMAAGRGHVGVVRLLLERGADVNAAAIFGSTALYFAAEGGHEEVVSILLSYGADPSKKGIIGTTPLLSASDRGHLGVVRQLLQVRGHVLDQRETALWGACDNGHVEILRALLLAGAGHSIPADTAWALRESAEEKGHTECVALLEWWEGELERGYVVHRARHLAGQHFIIQPTLAAASSASLASSLASVSSPALLGMLTPVLPPLPRVEVVRLSEDEETGALTDQGKRKVEEEHGGDVQGPSEAERDATVKYVMQDLHPELYTELMAGFYPLRSSQEEANDASSFHSLSDHGDY